MKKKNWILLIGIITLVIAIVGVSYAYFSANITGNESSTTVSVSGGTLGLTVNGGNSISISNIYPQSGVIATKTFTVTGSNTTDLIMPYTINLVIDSNTFSTGSIKYTLTSTNTDSNGTIAPSVATQTNIATGSSTIALGSGNFKNGNNKVHTYVLSIYYPDTGSSQNSEQGKTFTAHINVTGSEAQTPTLLSTKILGLGNANVTSTITTPGKAISTSGEAVLASTPDDYGTSYYYRGAVTNNYIVFANMCWRIVRVTGNGAIKLVLYNYNSGAVANPCDTAYDGTSNAFARYSGSTYTTSFNTNTSVYDNAYVGFMYGAAGSATYALEHANTNKSTILTNLETWYTSKLSSYASYLADTIWCNDKSVDTVYPFGTLGYGTNQTGYSARGRIYADNNYATSAAPTLICPNDSAGGKLSKLTADETTYGNGALTYKIGLLTADEVAYAGGTYGSANTTYYLNKNASVSGSWWWTLSPNSFNGGAGVFYVYATGGLYTATVDITSLALRPAVSLISTTMVTGGGTSSNPYIVQ